MKESQLIHIMKEPLNEVIEQKGIDNVYSAFYSKMIAFAIWNFKNHRITESDIVNKNNVTGMTTPMGEETESYLTIKDCILQYIDYAHNLDSDFLSKEYPNIAKKYNLYNIDKEYLSNNDKSIINLDEDKSKPVVDLYTVKDGDGREIMKTSNLEEANNTKNEGSNRTVQNSRNEIVNGRKTGYKSSSAVNTVLRAGSEIHCNNLNMYYKITDKAPGRSISGTYYLFDGRVFDGRYAICMKPEFAGKDKSCVIGFVNAADLKRK